MLLHSCEWFFTNSFYFVNYPWHLPWFLENSCWNQKSDFVFLVWLHWWTWLELTHELDFHSLRSSNRLCCHAIRKTSDLLSPEVRDTSATHRHMSFFVKRPNLKHIRHSCFSKLKVTWMTLMPGNLFQQMTCAELTELKIYSQLRVSGAVAFFFYVHVNAFYAYEARCLGCFYLLRSALYWWLLCSLLTVTFFRCKMMRIKLPSSVFYGHNNDFARLLGLSCAASIRVFTFLWRSLFCWCSLMIIWNEIQFVLSSTWAVLWS